MRTRHTWIPALAAVALLTPVGCDDPIAGEPTSSAPLGTERCLETMLDEDTSPGDPPQAEEPPEVDLEEGAPAIGGAAPVVAAGLRHPPRTTYRIEDIQADLWDRSYLDADPGRTRNDLHQHNTGRVALNIYWREWQPFPRSWDADARCPKLPGDAPDTAWVPYEGSCFRIHDAFDEQLREYSANVVVVTGILDAAPEWAISPSCPLPADRKKFCAPTTAAVAEFGKFAGMLARRYNGTPGVGRIADFIIHDEVNAGGWFGIGCGFGSNVGCSFDQWVSAYADSYNAAHDQIMKHQPGARVLVPLTHHFATADFDQSEDYDPRVSTRRFLHLFDTRVGSRRWRVAYHPDPKVRASTTVSAQNHPYVTPGDIGVLAGWLRKTFPGKPHTWNVQRTEQASAPLERAHLRRSPHAGAGGRGK